jgi:hypothetical protein
MGLGKHRKSILKEHCRRYRQTASLISSRAGRSAEPDKWHCFLPRIATLNAGHAALYLATYNLAFKPRNFMASSIMYFLCISSVHGPAAKCHLGSRNYFWTRISPCSMAKLASSLFAHSSQALAISSKSFSVPRPNFRAFSRKEPPLS